MIEHGIDIGWKHTLVGIVNLDSGIGPPQEGLRQIGAIANATLNFEISTTRAQGKACHTLLVEHTLHLVYPYGDRAILVLDNGAINGHVGGWTMVLRPVKLDATANPRTSQAYQCGLNHMVVIHKVALLNLVVSHLHASAQFGQYHHLDILVLDINGLVLLIHLLVAHRLDNGIRIYHATGTLINTFFQEHRVLLGLSYFVSRNSHDFSPSFYRHCI